MPLQEDSPSGSLKMQSSDKSNVDLEGGDGGGEDGGGRRSSAAGACGSHAGSCDPDDPDSHQLVTVSNVSENEIVGVSDKRRESSVSERSVEVDLESGTKVHLAKIERDCRICHLSLDASNQESGVPIELGCSCKDDLAAAHKHCAEAWFKIKGNKTCEICGSIAHNVAGPNEAELMEQWSEVNDPAAVAASSATTAETRYFWQGHRFLNFLLACMVFAFVISWLFHFNVPS